MKQVSHKIMSIWMAFVVLFSTMSFTIDMHYCGDDLMDIAVFHKVETCEMDVEPLASESCGIVKDTCCSDEQTFVTGQDELQLLVTELTFEQQVFITSFVYAYIEFLNPIDKEETSLKEYKPPLVIRDHIYKLDETYII